MLILSFRDCVFGLSLSLSPPPLPCVCVYVRLFFVISEKDQNRRNDGKIVVVFAEIVVVKTFLFHNTTLDMMHCQMIHETHKVLDHKIITIGIWWRCSINKNQQQQQSIQTKIIITTKTTKTGCSRSENKTQTI